MATHLIALATENSPSWNIKSTFDLSDRWNLDYRQNACSSCIFNICIPRRGSFAQRRNRASTPAHKESERLWSRIPGWHSTSKGNHLCRYRKSNVCLWITQYVHHSQCLCENGAADNSFRKQAILYASEDSAHMALTTTHLLPHPSG